MTDRSVDSGSVAEEKRLEKLAQADQQEIKQLLNLVEKQKQLEERREEIILAIGENAKEMDEKVVQIRDQMPQNISEKVVQHAFDSENMTFENISDEKMRKIAQEWEIVVKKGKEVNSLLTKLLELDKEIQEEISQEKSIVQDQTELEEMIQELSRLEEQVGQGGSAEEQRELEKLLKEEGVLIEELVQISEEARQIQQMEKKEKEDLGGNAITHIDNFMSQIGFMTGRGNFIHPEYRKPVMEVEEEMKEKTSRVKEEMNELRYDSFSQSLESVVKSFQKEFRQLKKVFGVN